MPPQIHSKNNPLIKHICKLQRTSYRKKTGESWVEGKREVALALENHWPLHTIVYCGPSLDARVETALKQYTDSSRPALQSVSPEVWAHIGYRETEQTGAIFNTRLHNVQSQSSLFGKDNEQAIIVLDSLEKPGNIGAILRSADAVGQTTVVLTGQSSDLYGPNLIRASLGAIFTTNVIYMPESELLSALQIAERYIVAITPESGISWHAGTVRNSDVLVFGSEAHGVSDFWKQNAHASMALPMRGQLDSLNVAQCATVLMYDRQD